MTARLTLEYDGSAFSGWAAQPDRRTVQAVVEEALAIALRRPVPLAVAGRTDAGVHARGQVASHAGAVAARGHLNSLLPPDVRILASEPAPERFHARHDACSRTYRYRILAGGPQRVFEQGRSLWLRRAPDRTVLDECAARLLGRHDFTAFTPTQTQHRHFERELVRSEWVDEGDGVIAYWVEASSFLRGMVRALVGTMLAIEGGRIGLGELDRLLAGAPRPQAGDSAVAHGLYLEHVRY